MGRKRRRILKWLSFAFALLIFVGAGQALLFKNMDHNQLRVEGFYMEEPDSLDVVFLGSSEVFADFSSAQAYDEFGFTSYPFVVNANPVTLWKYELKEAVDRQHPQLIVVETNGALYDAKRLYKEAYVRRMVDNMPDSENRRAMIRDMGKDEILSYQMPILKYHGNWENPKAMLKGAINTLAMYIRGNAFLKGVSTNTGSLRAKEVRNIKGDESEEPLDEQAEKALRDFMDYCRDEKIENVIFVRFPHCITDDEDSYTRFRRSNAAGRLIRSYGFDFINLDQYEDEIGLDPENDFYNNEHMNVYGMKKMTSWFGHYLAEHYEVTPRPQTEKSIRQWESSVLYTRAFCDYFEDVKEKNHSSDEEINESAEVMRRLKALLPEE